MPAARCMIMPQQALLVYNSIFINPRELLVRYLFIALVLLSACSPKFDWRDVRGTQAPFTVLMPGKPDILSRQIQLGPESVLMQMTAAQVNGVTFAVGAIHMSDNTQAQAGISLIRQGLLHNLQGKMNHEKYSTATLDHKLVFNHEFDASSFATDQHGSANRIVGKIIASDAWVFQVMVAGPEKNIDRDSVDTFLSSFKPL